MKNKFILPENNLYFCGHSLGPMPISAYQQVEMTLKQCAQSGVKSWNEHHWIDLLKHVSTKIAPLIGAKMHEVIISDSTSVNLYKALKCALYMNSSRKIILTTEDIFPADLYITDGVCMFDQKYQTKKISIQNLSAELNADVAVLVLSHVNYRDASVLNIFKITQIAHQKGILTLWDLSHSVGILPIDLNKSYVDFAVGCTYKYLNGGPGSPAFIYVNEQHLPQAKSPICGWMGHKKPFDFNNIYQSEGINKFMGGTPAILSLAALNGALDIYQDLNIQALHQQTQQYSEYLISQLEKLGLQIITPKTSNSRGGHMAFLHPEAYQLSRALLAHNVIIDYREPNLIRMCINPLYISLNDINQAVCTLETILKNKIYQHPEYQNRKKVT